MSPQDTASMARSQSMKTVHILRENLRMLIAKEGLTQESVSHACGHEKQWINRILSGIRGVTIKDLVLLADLFHLAGAYQLFMPGISRQTERRKRTDRRSGVERRGNGDRHMVELPAHTAKTISHATSSASDRRARLDAIASEFAQRILAENESADGGGQTSASRRIVSQVAVRDRTGRGSPPEKAAKQKVQLK